MKLLVASEYSDPSFHQSLIITRLQNIRGSTTSKPYPPLLLITKNIEGCRDILLECRYLNQELLVHITVTGYGHTILEPNVKPWEEVVENTKILIHENLLNPEKLVLRVDPLIPRPTRLENTILPALIQEFSKLGIRRLRTSVIDYYPHVRERFGNAGLAFNPTFSVPYNIKLEALQRVSRIAESLNMQVEICAEGISSDLIGNNVSIQGCASQKDWIVSLDPVINPQRKLCTCDLAKEDLLKGLEKGCPHRCLYCYWRY